MTLFHFQSLLGHEDLKMTRVYAEQVNSEDAISAYKPVVTRGLSPCVTAVTSVTLYLQCGVTTCVGGSVIIL